MSQRFLRRTIEDEEFWLDLEAGRFYGVNDSASAILDLWSKSVRDPAAIAARLSEQFEVSVAEAREAVDAFLPAAKARGLLPE